VVFWHEGYIKRFYSLCTIKFSTYTYNIKSMRYSQQVGKTLAGQEHQIGILLSLGMLSPKLEQHHLSRISKIKMEFSAPKTIRL
jgi:hypothetical protein